MTKPAGAGLWDRRGGAANGAWPTRGLPRFREGVRPEGMDPYSLPFDMSYNAATRGLEYRPLHFALVCFSYGERRDSTMKP